jgi:hypothetical protein
LNAVKYTSQDWNKVIILGFISLIPLTGIFFMPLNLFSFIFLIIAFFPLGYLYKILKTTFNGSDELPQFDEWKLMFLSGLKVALVLIIYAIPLMIIFLIPFLSQLALGNFTIPPFTIAGFLTGSGVPLVFFIIGLLEYMALANLTLYQGEVAAAFRFREILQRISALGWRKYLISYVVIWLLGLTTLLLLSLTFRIFMGIIIGPLLIIPFYAIFSARYLALLFASSEA